MSLDNNHNLEEYVASVPSCEDVTCAAASPRYITPELMAELTREQTDPFTWIAILARLEGSGLLVPPQDEVAFMFSYQHVLKTLLTDDSFRMDADNQQLADLCRVLPLRYVSAKSCNLLQSVSYGIDIILLHHSGYPKYPHDYRGERDDYYSAYFNRAIEPSFRSNDFDNNISDNELSEEYDSTRQDKLEQSQFRLYDFYKKLGVVEKRLFIRSLLQQHDLERVFFLWEKCRVHGWKFDLGLVYNNWCSQLYHCYQSGVFDNNNYNLILQPENCLWRVVNGQYNGFYEEYYNIKYAYSLYHMLPGSVVERQMLDLACASFEIKFDDNGHALINLRDGVSTEELIKQLYILFPEKRNTLLSPFNNYRGNYLEDLCQYMILFLPPKFLFKLFQIKLTDAKIYNSQQLFKILSKILGNIFTNNFYPDDEDFEFWFYFVIRIKFELGDEYLETFCEFFSSKLRYRFVQYFLAKLNYEDREEIPWVYNPACYPFDITSRFDPIDSLLSWIDHLYSQPDKHWGPKFSRYFCDKLLAHYVVSNLKDIGRFRLDAYSHNPHAQSQLRVLALSVDPTVKLELTQPINEIITTFVQEKERQAELVESLEGKAELDALLQRQFWTQQMEFCDNAIYSLNLLLDYFAWADHIDSMCAQAIAQPV